MRGPASMIFFIGMNQLFSLPLRQIIHSRTPASRIAATCSAGTSLCACS